MKLVEMTEVIRSKNSGPYELTFDFMFKSEAYFEKVRASGYFSEASICRLLGIEPSDIIDVVWFQPAHALKITIKRPYPSGAIGERDVYGAQQAAPFMEIDIGMGE